MRHRKPCSSGADRCRAPAGVLVFLAAFFAAGCSNKTGEGATTAEAVPVQRGPLRIAVTEGGDMESGNPVSVRSELEGRAAILELIPEGTHVKKGDFLVKLDSASIQDNLNRQEIKLEDARSARDQAEEAVAIQKKKNQEDETAAQTNYELAVRAYDGYVTGTGPLEKRKLESALTIAKERQTRAKEKAEASERLSTKDYISKTEYLADLLAQKQADEEVDIATRNLEHQIRYTYEDQVKKLMSDRDVKELALQRVRQQAQSELKQKIDNLEARGRAFTLEKEARDKLVANLDRTTIRAPADGLVVYARQERGRMGGSEPIGLGKEVREQEEMLRIPDLSQMVVQVDIHESAVKKVNAGQRAWVRVDAIPNRTFPGVVTKVSLVPSTQSSWLNPDLKVYQTVVRLEETVEGIKPGMHAQVEILVQEIADALQIPLQAARQSGSKTFAYVKGPAGAPELREIKVGLNNNSAVHVTEGLKDGELVFLAPPPGAPALPAPEKSPFLEPQAPAPAAEAGGPPGPGAGAGPGGGAGVGRPMDDGNVPGGGGRPQMTEEQRKAWAERMKNMTPEEREKMRQAGGGRRRGGGGGGEGGRGGQSPPAGEPGKDQGTPGRDPK